MNAAEGGGGFAEDVVDHGEEDAIRGRDTEVWRMGLFAGLGMACLGETKHTPCVYIVYPDNHTLRPPRRSSWLLFCSAVEWKSCIAGSARTAPVQRWLRDQWRWREFPSAVVVSPNFDVSMLFCGSPL